jgi:excinuclease UvrABC nuclease subunit
MNDDIKNTLAVIPNQPGCYQFFDEKGTVIYVGKAKDLTPLSLHKTPDMIYPEKVQHL